MLLGAREMGCCTAGLYASTVVVSESKEKDSRFVGCIVAVVLLLVVFPRIAVAQQMPEQELKIDTKSYTPAATLRVRKNVVQMDVVVRDAKGQAVGALKQQDFKVYDKGKEQTISQFTVESAAPRIVSRATSSTSTSPTSTAVSVPSSSAATSSQQRFIALFFDDRNTPFSDLAHAREAAEKFVREDLHGGDRVGVFTASASTTLDFTDDTQKLRKTIESVHLQALGAPEFRHSCTQYPIGPYAAHLIYDEGDTETRQLYLCGNDTPTAEAQLDVTARTLLSSAEIISKLSLGSLDSVIARLRQMPGHRIVVLTSSGFFTLSLQRQIDNITRDALRAGVVINSLYAGGLVALAPGGDAKDSPLYSRGPAAPPPAESPTDRRLGSRQLALSVSGVPASEYERLILKEQRDELDDVMVDLARDTGGIFFHNNNDLDLALREMAAVPDVSYRLGFSPADLKPDGKFHDLKVKLAVPGRFQIQTRRGYFAPSEATRRAEGRVDRLNDEVLKTDGMQGIPAEVTARPGQLPTGRTGLQVSLHVDLGALSFQKNQGRHIDKLTVVCALFNSQGDFVTGEMGVVDMALKNDTLAALSKRGLNTTMVLQVPEGKYRLRLVVEEAGSGKMFAVTRPGDIP
jgi:VWFA-related protein